MESIRDVVQDRGSSYRSTMSLMTHMNPYTSTERVALVHSTGTGKTRKSLMVAMQYNKDITIVVVHNNQSKPFVSERLAGGTLDKLYPGFNKRTDVITCRSIITAVNKRDSQRLDFYFRDRVVIVDEMHHLRNRGDKKKSLTPMFDTLVYVLSSYRDSLVLFLTATPLVDNVSELAGVYTLLKGMQPPESSYEYMVSNLVGHVSVLKKQNLPVKYVEVRCPMVEAGRQWYLYQKHQADRSSVHSRTSAISRFVSNDDEEASEEELPTFTIISRMLDNMVFSTQSEYEEAVMEALRCLSVKAYMLIRNIRENRGHTHFLFDSWKKRGGANRLLDILTMPPIGYVSVTNEQEVMDVARGPKILALHNLSTSAYSKLIDIFNSYENRDGSLIEILLATPKFSESMSITTARYSHIYNSPWNIPNMEQINGRVNRRSSLWYLPKEERVITSFSYVLYKPNMEPTIESHIRRQADMKYNEILPVLEELDRVKVENMFCEDRSFPKFFSLAYPQEGGVNHAVRMYTPTLNHRNVDMDLEPLLSKLEKYDDLYSMMDTTNSGLGFTRIVSGGIKLLEYLYVENANNNTLTEKQSRALRDTSKAFIEYGGCMYHVLYFTNADTAEYQRLSSLSRRVARRLDRGSNTWKDEANNNTIELLMDTYMGLTTSYVETIEDKWKKYGSYTGRYIMSSCYRLVRYRDKEELGKVKHAHDVDRRKISRGEKWQYYSKPELVSILLNFNNLDRNAKAIVMSKSCDITVVFSLILESMKGLDMVLSLPI